MNRGIAHVQALTEAAHGQLRGARHDRIVANQITIQRQRNSRSTAHRVLKRGIATGVPTGVEIGEAIQRLLIADRVTEQMGDAEIHAATPGEHFMADRAIHRVGITLGLLLGEINADLHWPTGVHRVKAAEQGFAHGHHADEVIENRAQLLFTARRIEAIVVGFAAG
ncbi:hypothetical protein D3C80_1488320 [compost metagenome]